MIFIPAILSHYFCVNTNVTPNACNCSCPFSITESAVGGLGFVKYLESCVSKVGGSATFECEIHSDDDAPQIQWSVSPISLSAPPATLSGLLRGVPRVFP